MILGGVYVRSDGLIVKITSVDHTCGDDVVVMGVVLSTGDTGGVRVGEHWVVLYPHLYCPLPPEEAAIYTMS